jgi:hypothetical protein
VERARSTGAVSDVEARTWLDFLDDAQRCGRLFCTLTGFIVCGKKV